MKHHQLTALRVILTVLSVLTVGFIFFNSMQNADDSSARSSLLLESVNAFLRSVGLSAEMSDYFIRKAAHFTEYFVLGLLLSGMWYAYLLRRGRMLLSAMACGLAVAVCDELIQLTSAGRSCEVTDMALDFSAVLCVSLLMTLILYTVEKKRVRKEGNDRE